MGDQRRQGTIAEDTAAEFLRQEGLTIIRRRYKAQRGEIDIVALDGHELVFVEVKSSVLEESAPEADVTERKRRRMVYAARQYLSETEFSGEGVRFDLVTVTPHGVRHFQNAFDAFGID